MSQSRQNYRKTDKNVKKPLNIFAENIQKQSKFLIFIKKTTKMSKTCPKTQKNEEKPSNIPQKIIKI